VLPWASPHRQQPQSGSSGLRVGKGRSGSATTRTILQVARIGRPPCGDIEDGSARLTDPAAKRPVGVVCPLLARAGSGPGSARRAGIRRGPLEEAQDQKPGFLAQFLIVFAIMFAHCFRWSRLDELFDDESSIGGSYPAGVCVGAPGRRDFGCGGPAGGHLARVAYAGDRALPIELASSR
jgi:hypothetical protein